MSDRCTCGAVLPSDARFCHRCGKPQGDDPALLVEEAPEAPPPAVAPPPAPEGPIPISFHNFAAVRVAFVTALAVFLVNVIPFPTAIRSFLMPICGGFLSVYLYKRWTGQDINLRGGLTLGWITGIFCFMIAMVLFTLVVLVLSQPDAVAVLRQKLEGQNSAEFEQLAKIFENRDELVPTLASGVMALFVVFTLLPVIGAALGAKVFQKQQ